MQQLTLGQAGQSIESMQSKSFDSDAANFIDESRWQYILKNKTSHITHLHVLPNANQLFSSTALAIISY